jgi:hypothetical protein
MTKIELPGIINEIGKIEKVNAKGFRQFIVLEQPPLKDELERVKSKAHYYQCEVYSNSETDSRFITDKPAFLRAKVKATLYLNGQRWWHDKYGYQHRNQLALAKIERL